jgi:uncharacterized membrane protein YdbT with pleckstrin-like domain
MGSFVIGVSCLLLAVIPGGAWGVPPGIWSVAALGIIGFAVLSRYSWKFVIDADRLTSHYGMISRKQKSVRIRDLRKIELYQPWGDKIFSVGTLAFDAAGSGEAEVIFWGIKQPADWRDRIQKMVDRGNDPHCADDQGQHNTGYRGDPDRVP